jgi:hypothetical protein
VLEADDMQVKRELKAACLAAGGSPGDCQAQPAHNLNTLSQTP